MDVADILAKLKGVKRCGNGWQAHCPAHDDRRQSLHISEGKDGRALIHCHAGCSVDDICAAIGLATKDLFPEPVRKQKPLSLSEIIAVYDYKDANGKLLFQVCRTADKRFFQRRPDGAGGWVNGLGNIKPTLYRLPELLEAVQRDEMVFIPEGEKDVDNLARLGLAATTSPMGAGKWRDYYCDWLKGANCVILPDNDGPGRRHAQQVAQSLHGKAVCVKVLELPGLPEKGDVSDWLAAGGTKEELLRLAQETPEWRPESPSEDEKAAAHAGYKIQDGRIVWLKPTRDGVLPTYLTNFTAKVKRDIVFDDGTAEARFFELEGTLASGRPFPRIKVPADKFFAMNWLGSWGIDAVIAAGAGAKDRVREAIQLFSSGAACERVFTHTGWRKFDGKWVYLHAGGAVGCDGVLVEMETLPLMQYVLPTKGVDARAGMEASLRLLNAAPAEISLPLLAATWRAPTAGLLYPSVVLWLHGPSGSFKSTLAALYLSHFGGPFTKDSLPGSWLATDNALERLCFLARDTLVVVDDYAPEQNPREGAALDRRVNRIVRQVGNRAARSRLGGDLRARPDMPPNALVVSTGEQLPLGVTSVAARILPVLCERERVNLEALTYSQAEAHKLAWAMRGYIEWLAPRLDDLAQELPRRFEELRARATVEGHARLPEAVAHLQLGVELGIEYAKEIGAVDMARAEEISQSAWNVLLELAREHAKTLEEERPTLKFLQTLDAIFAQGKGHLVDRATGGQPPMAQRFGWVCAANECGEESYRRTGEFLGWVDREKIYLLPEAAWRAVNEYLRATGGFPVRERTLRDALAREGVLVRGEDGRTTRKVRCEGVPRRVMQLELVVYLTMLEKGARSRFEDKSSHAFPLSGNAAALENQGLEAVVPAVPAVYEEVEVCEI